MKNKMVIVIVILLAIAIPFVYSTESWDRNWLNIIEISGLTMTGPIYNANLYNATLFNSTVHATTVVNSTQVTNPPWLVNASGPYLYDSGYTVYMNDSYLTLAIQNATNLSYIAYTNKENLFTSDQYLDNGTKLNFVNQSDESYFYYNATNNTLQLIVNGILQQEWGSSTTIYGQATFLDNAFFENISGSGMVIDTDVYITGDTSSTYYFGNGSTLDGVCTTNGTGCDFNATDIFNLTFIDTNTQKTTNGFYLYNDSTIIYFNDTQLNNTIDSKLETTTYYPTSMYTQYGSNETADNVTLISYMFDGLNHTVNEDSGANAMLIYVNFTDVESFNFGITRVWYDGGSSHDIEICLYNYITTNWDCAWEIVITSDYQIVSSNVFGSDNYISGGVVQTKLEHDEIGSTQHYLYIDSFTISDGVSAITSNNHDALSSRNDLNNHPQYLDLGGTRNITGNLTVEGSYLNMYNQTVTVAKRGGDYTTVQGAVDSITDSSTSKRYTILVYPGIYNEEIDLTGKPYISLRGIGGFDNVIVNSSGVTFQSAESGDTSIQDMAFWSYPDEDTDILINHTGGALTLNNCDLLMWSNQTALASNMIEVHSGDFQMYYTTAYYYNYGNDGGLKTQRVLYIQGDLGYITYFLNDNIIYMEVRDNVENYKVINEETTATTGGLMANNVMTLNNIANSFIFLGGVIYLDGAGFEKEIFQNSINCYSVSGICYSIFMDTDTNDGILNSHHNVYYASTNWASIATGDSINSNFDVIKNGTFTGGGNLYSYNDIQQVVTVGKSGAEFTTIQEAIDSITDASTTKRYIIQIGAGDYPENVVGKNYVNLVGLGSSMAITAAITPTSGVAYTSPNGLNGLTNINLKMATTTDSTVIVNSGITGLNDCRLAITSSTNGIKGSLINQTGGVLVMTGGQMIYTLQGSQVGSIEHNIIQKTGGALDLYGTQIAITVADVDDDINVFSEEQSSVTLTRLSNNNFEVYATSATYSGETIFYAMEDVGFEKNIFGNIITITSSGGGNGYAYYVNTTTDDGHLHSTSNHIEITGFDSNNFVWVNETGDYVASHFDDVIAENKSITKGGNFEYVYTDEPGQLTASQKIGVGTNEPLSQIHIHEDISDFAVYWATNNVTKQGVLKGTYFGVNPVGDSILASGQNFQITTNLDDVTKSWDFLENGTTIFPSGEVYVNGYTSIIGATDIIGNVDLTGTIDASLQITGATDIVAGEDMAINYDGPDGDSYLHYYDNGGPVNEYLAWDDVSGSDIGQTGEEQFELSHSLGVSGSIFSSLQMIALYFDAATYVRGQDLRSETNIYNNFDGADGDTYHYFYEDSSTTGEFFMWDDDAGADIGSPGEDSFELSDSLGIEGTLITADTITVAGTGSLIVAEDISGGGDVFIDDDLYLGYDLSGGIIGINFANSTDDSAATLQWWSSFGTFFVANDLLAVQDLQLQNIAGVGSDPLCWDGGGTTSIIGDCTSLTEHKRNIQNLSIGLNKVMELRPVTYFLRQRDENGTLGEDVPTLNKNGSYDYDEFTVSRERDFGFIAEEVFEVSPLLTTERRGGNASVSGVKYMRMTALLTKAIQEQQAEIEDLELRLSRLERWIDRQGPCIQATSPDGLNTVDLVCN